MNQFCFISFQEDISFESKGAELVDLDFLADLDEVQVVAKTDQSVCKNTAHSSRDEWISLNVGGTRFLTCRSTLAMNAGQTGMLVSQKHRLSLSRCAFFDENCIPFTNNTSHHCTTHDLVTSLKGNYEIGICRALVGPLIKMLHKLKCS